MNNEWRKELNDFEKNMLLPSIKGRLEILKAYFKEIQNHCNENLNNETFGALILSITTQGVKAPLYITAQMTHAEISHKFFQEISLQCQNEFLNPIEEILDLINDDISLKEFMNILNKTNFICSIALQTEDKLFMFKFNTFISLHEKYSGEVKSVKPLEYEAITIPTKNVISNIIGVCKGTIESIQHWQKEVMEWKSKTLELETVRLNRQNQFLTIILALSLSALFFALNDPYQLWKSESFVNSLKKSQAELEIELSKEKLNSSDKDKEITNLKIKIESLSKNNKPN